LSAALGRTPTVDEVASTLFDVVRELESPAADMMSTDTELETSMGRLVDRYIDDCWTWRR
jgi:hypothetical protein